MKALTRATLAFVAVCAGLMFPAAAQVRVPSATPDLAAGITVTGRATVAAVPDRLRVVVRLTPRNVTGAQLEALATSVATAMRTGGIADAKTVLPIAGYLGPGSTVAVTGTIAKPTRESVESIVRATLKAVPDATALALQNGYQVQSSYAVDDCSPYEARAQIAAIADARARAERIAAAAGLRVGTILAVNEGSVYVQPACTSDPDVFAANPAGNQDPYGSLSVPIAVSAIVLFSVK